jgi:hypothetical protein
VGRERWLRKGPGERRRLRYYGVSSRQWDALLELQGFRCAICREVRPLVLDHDHRDGHLRGALCRNCNIAIGFLHDDPALLRAAAAYLEHDRYERNLNDLLTGIPRDGTRSRVAEGVA